jgi:deoxyribodipyrimidine photolyase-related protein
MENFYQFMRKKHSILLDSDGKPEGGKWNYDSENRKSIKKNPDINLPPKFAPDEITNSVINLVKEKFAKNPGSIEPFWFAVTQKQAEQAFDDFLKNKMAKFGDYEDAMLSENGFLYHSVISLYLNVGFLDPRKIIQTIQKNYHDGKIPLNSAEGFIRQILGWREFVRGIYWKFMPQYYGKNYFDHTRKLPEFFWTGNTDLNCLRACISQTLGESYAHHIQRLMVIGNFSLLAGLEPKQVAEWFLSVYSDAFEWVELPNVYGLALFADGGIIASKPYVSSGNYIQKMSNYCDSCKYDIKEKSGKNACPFNYLYWNFLLENKDKLEKNPRNYVMYNVIGKMDESKIKSIKKDSKEFLKTLD